MLDKCRSILSVFHFVFYPIPWLQVCPVCALNLGKDVVGHFKTHHMNSIKVLYLLCSGSSILVHIQHWFCFLKHFSDFQTRRRSQKSGFWNFYAGRMIGGMTAKGGSENVNALAPDPLLSPFLCSIPCSDSRDDQSQDMCSIDDTSSIPKTSRYFLP